MYQAKRFPARVSVYDPTRPNSDASSLTDDELLAAIQRQSLKADFHSPGNATARVYMLSLFEEMLRRDREPGVSGKVPG